MKYFILGACLALFAGCASTRYRVVCKDAPQSYPYLNKRGNCVCESGGAIMTQKTKIGVKTFEIQECTEHYKVYRVKRVRGGK